MRFETEQCLICNKIYPFKDIVFIDLDFKVNPPKLKKVEDSHCRVRIICKHCVEGIKKLEA